MAKLIIAPSAQQDLSDIHDYIARDKPIAGGRDIRSLGCEISSVIGFEPDLEANSLLGIIRQKS